VEAAKIGSRNTYIDRDAGSDATTSDIIAAEFYYPYPVGLHLKSTHCQQRDIPFGTYD